MSQESTEDASQYEVIQTGITYLDRSVVSSRDIALSEFSLHNSVLFHGNYSSGSLQLSWAYWVALLAFSAKKYDVVV